MAPKPLIVAFPLIVTTDGVIFGITPLVGSFIPEPDPFDYPAMLLYKYSEFQELTFAHSSFAVTSPPIVILPTFEAYPKTDLYPYAVVVFSDNILPPSAT